MAKKGGMEEPLTRPSMKVSRKQMWFNLLMAGVAPEKIEQQPNAVLLALWNQLRPNQHFTPIPGKAATSEVLLADLLPDEGFGPGTGFRGSQTTRAT